MHGIPSVFYGRHYLPEAIKAHLYYKDLLKEPLSHPDEKVMVDGDKLDYPVVNLPEKSRRK
jgi:hypothetical protein